VDGNYRAKLGDLVTSQADMIVYLNLPWRVKFWRVLKRSIVRAWTRELIGGGNVETRRQFFSREAPWWEYISQRKRFVKQSGLVLTCPQKPIQL